MTIVQFIIVWAFQTLQYSKICFGFKMLQALQYSKICFVFQSFQTLDCFVFKRLIVLKLFWRLSSYFLVCSRSSAFPRHFRSRMKSESLRDRRRRRRCRSRVPRRGPDRSDRFRPSTRRPTRFLVPSDRDRLRSLKWGWGRFS